MVLKSVKERGIRICVVSQALRISKSCYRYDQAAGQQPQLGLWPLLYVFLQPEWFRMEPQVYLEGLQRVRADLEDQISQTFDSR
jgi:hypothetical protein